MIASDAMKGAEQFLMNMDDFATRQDDATALHSLVEWLEDYRRHVTTVIETARAQLAKVVGELQAEGEIPETDDGARLKAVPKVRERYDHDLIAKRVLQRSIYTDMANPDDDHGDGIMRVIDDPTEAAQRAIAYMRELYVAPSTAPKQTALIKVGFETKFGAMASREEVGTKVIERA